MSKLLEQIINASPEKRELLVLMLKEQGIDVNELFILPQSRETNTFPVSFAQQRLWFLDQLEPGSPVYNIPLAVRLTGQLDVSLLERVLNEIVRRHEALRTTFSTEDGEPVQVVAPELTLSIPVIDMQGEPETAVRAQVLSEAQRSFDLADGPLLRVTLLRLDAEEHVVLFNMHHIISDGWSMNVIVREIATLYAAFAAGRPSPLPDLKIQYADFAHWQRQWLQGEKREAQLAYWREQLADVPPVLELPTDRPRPATPTNRGGHYHFQLDPDLLPALKALSQEEDATLFMTLLAGFQLLLARYTGQDDIPVGTPIANRNRPQIEDLIGFFVNTLVMRTDLSGDVSFRQLLQRVQEVALGAYAHQDLPFEMLVEALHPERNLSHTPLFQVMFMFQSATAKTLELPGLTLTPVETETGVSTFDMTLSLQEEARGLSGSVEYSAELFDEDTIARMVSHLEVLLQAAVSHPDQSVWTLPLLTEAERQQVVKGWNETAVSFPDQTVHQLIAAQAARTPDAIAAQCGDQQLTYAQLNRRANQLAHHLRSLGVGPETLVGISVGRSLEMLVGLLGILKAGGAYLPLDPNYPPERLAYMLADAAVSVVLTTAALSAEIEGLTDGRSVCTIRLDADWDAIAQADASDPEPLATPDNLAYVIYTSGSTGRPKGVEITHRSVVNHNTAIIEMFRLQPSDRVLQFATINFDAAVEEIFPTLMRGAALVLRTDDMLVSSAELTQLVTEQQLTILDLPTAFWHDWVHELARAESFLPPSLRLVVVGGEKASAERVALWRELVDEADVTWLNTYGPTEATIIATAYELDGPVVGEVPIGQPIANTQIYLLDEKMQPAPVGVPGEMHIGGVGVARGYLRRPELTAARFIPDPFSPEPQARLYKSGDLARWRPDGQIEFLGRVDHQVKIRGFRVEPGEIEAVLNQHPALREAVVTDWDVADGAENKRLAAYVVPHEPPGPNVSELRHFLGAKLPEYMIPAAFVTLEALPLSPSGKVNRRALPAPEGLRPELETPFVAPRTAVEEIVAGLWAQLLGLEQGDEKTAVGVYDNFFELGGHSLMATQLMSRLREAFQVELPLRDLFEAPTVAGLAERVEIAQRTAAGVAAPPIEPVSRDQELPLSFSQQRLWFLDQLEPGSPQYNIPDAVRLKGALNVAALEQALNAIVQRHEVLRTTFKTVDGRAMLDIAPELHLPLPVTDLRHLPLAEREEEALRLATEEAKRPFDLAQGPLVRVQLLRLGEQEHIILLTMHHTVSDGWSTGVFIREIAALYQAFAAGEPSPLPDLPLQYADYAYWQRNWLQGEVLAAQLDYWREQLADSPPLLELPTDRPRPAVQTERGAHQTFTLPPELSRELAALSQKYGVTMFMTLLAAFQTLLYRYAGQDDISVGTPIANRNRSETEGLIGFFVNTLVLRTDLSGAPSFRELLQRVREVALGAYAHQDLPFDKLVDALQPERDMSHTPLFQVMFILQNAPVGGITLPDLTLESIEVDTGIANFDITLAMQEGPDGLGGAIEYNVDLFDDSTISRMIGHFQTLLAGIAADPTRSIAALPLLTEAEWQQVVRAWNDTAVSFPTDQTLPQLIEAQVARTPDAVAAIAGEEQLTYDQLNRRANQLAHHLRDLGVGPDVIVGISVGRSLEMLVGLLGILKAGGAYLPLDPSYPAERLAYMITDAAVPVIVTTDDVLAALADLATDGATLVNLDGDWPQIARRPEENPVSGVQAHNLAYLIYTSGSTGRPKGVMIEHRNVVNHNLAVIRSFGLQASDRVLQFATINFDTAVEEIFPTLICGATLVLRTDEMLTTGSDLPRLVAEQQLTVLDLPTAYWHDWVTEMTRTSQPLPEPLRLVVVGGEKASAEKLASWMQSAAGTAVTWLNTYGPTEGTIVATAYEQKEETAGYEVPIGRPLANMKTYILDRQLQPAPVGVPGELHIGGVGVARGYLNRPELTADKFIADPFSDTPNARLYKTGDLVRWQPNGEIEFLGRVDHQVKIRGFRIEPGEVEARLEQHPALQEAIVMAREDMPGHTRLVAYVVAPPEAAPSVSELRAFLQEQLPEYMVPSAFVTLEALPMLPNGKVNRRALPAPSGERPELEAAFVAPRNEKEQALADIWTEVLGLKRANGRSAIGVHDNFFELGGDSILSIQVVARANQAGLRLTPRQLFAAPTVAGLAAVAGEGPVIEAEQGVVTGSAPLTPIQHWFFERIDRIPNPHHWNQALLLQVEQRLEPEWLETAVRHLLRHHDALRLRFEPTDDGWIQTHAGDDGPVPFVWEDLSHLAPALQKRALEAKAREYQASLDISAGPLARVIYFDLGGEQNGRLLVVIHHLAVDGVSWRILLEDLQRAYLQLSQGQAVQLPPKTTSFKQWAEKLQTYAQSEAVRAEIDYWAETAVSTRLPLDYPEQTGTNTEASARGVVVTLPESETDALLREVPAAYRTEINDVLLTALVQAVGQWTEIPSLLVDLEGHGREDILEGVDISRTVGWFTAVYPVALDLRGVNEPGKALQAIKEQLRQVPGRGIGYGLLRYLAQDDEIQARLQSLPRSEVSFNYLGQFNQGAPQQAMGEGSPFTAAPESRGPDRDPKGDRDHLIEVDGAISGGQLRLEWTYSENLHRRATIERLAQNFLTTLRSLIAHCQSPEAGGVTPSDFPLANLDQKKLDKVLAKMSNKGRRRR